MDAPRSVGLIGDPVEHSVSPAMHNAAFKATGLPYTFEKVHVTRDALPPFFEKMREENWLGVNVTIPHKEIVAKYLDDIDPTAQKIGAVNAIQNKNGTLIGFNTDGDGFLASLRNEAGWDPGGKKVAILGAGGAARAIAYTLCMEKISHLTIINRTFDRANAVATMIRNNFGRTIVEVASPPSTAAQSILPFADLIVNCTSIGMYPKADELPISPVIHFAPHQLVSDIIFNPPETALLAHAKKDGANVLGGVGMLVYQGALSFELFTGVKPPVDVMRSAALGALL